MKDRLNEAIGLINRGALNDSFEILQEMVNENRANHQALFLLGCLLYNRNDTEAMKGFVMARSKAPQNSTYEFFEKLFSVKMTNPNRSQTVMNELADAALPVLNDETLTPLPLAILTQLFIDADRREFALECYGRILQGLGWDNHLTVLNNCFCEDDTWSWDETLYWLRSTMDEDGFTDDHLRLWLYFLEEVKSEKAQALMRMLMLQFMVRRTERGSTTKNNLIEQTQSLFGTQQLPKRVVTVLPIYNQYSSMNVPYWVSPARYEWDYNIVRATPTWLGTSR